MLFYLGTHMPHWLRDSEVPLFVSHRRLARDKGVPKAACRWALDSGGFTELSMYGEWRTEPAEYVEAVERYTTEVGMLDWAAPQDWMCEPHMLAKTHKTVAEHQVLTTVNYLELVERAPHLPFIPVLQGWTLDDYLTHAAFYERQGVVLSECSTVGVGSVCRRESTDEIGEIMAELHQLGLKLHGFGVKGAGIRKYGEYMHSADSMAWSARGRRIQPCPHRGVTSCANCKDHALEWRSKFAV